MAKNKNQGTAFSMAGVDPVKVVSEHLTKKGKIKGSKKEVKNIKSICPHHALNRKGKKKAKVQPLKGKMCQCKICQEKYKQDFYTDQELDKAYNEIKPQMSQAKLLVQATNADKYSVQYISEANIYIDRFGKFYRNLRSVGQKQDKTKKKKKKDNLSSELGGWSTR